jgi:argininosuccinate lyase
VHSLVERELGARCGDLGQALHTGRSRNDQVATDLRLYLRERIARPARRALRPSARRWWKGRAHAAAPMPGYTHLQRAQPITIGHHALAHAERWPRRERLLDALPSHDECPLGSGALAGTGGARSTAKRSPSARLPRRPDPQQPRRGERFARPPVRARCSRAR